MYSDSDSDSDSISVVAWELCTFMVQHSLRGPFYFLGKPKPKTRSNHYFLS